MKASKVSAEKRQEIREAFDLFNTDEKGKLPTAELEIALRALGLVVSPERLAALRSTLDKNRSGYITFEDFFAQMLKLLEEKDYEADMRKAFKLFDDEDKGAISLNNLARVARELGEEYSTEDLQAMIDEADRDRDGIVNEKEFLLVMKKAMLY